MSTNSNQMLSTPLVGSASNSDEEALNDVSDGRIRSASSKDWESEEGSDLGFWDIVLLHTAYSTAGGVIMMPYIFGQWGYVLAPILIAIWMLLVYGIAAFVCDIITGSKEHVKHHGDVGFELSGKWGRRIFNLFLLVNMWFYLNQPIAMDTIAISLQVLASSPFNGGKGCAGWWRIIAFGALLIILQFVKRWKETSKLAYGSVFLLLIKVLVLIPYGLVANQDEYMNSNMTEKNLGPAQPILNPEPEWTSIIAGLFVYTSIAILLVADTLPHSKEPKEYKKAMGLAHIFMFTLYMIPGFCGVFLWGWNVPFLINTAFTSSQALSIILNLIIVFQVTIDFIITALVVNDSFRRSFQSPDPKLPEWWEHFKATIVSSGQSLTKFLLSCLELSTNRRLTPVAGTLQ
ncbi:hypothetical protein ACHAWF_013360 [Thalassiosira exigua]